ncbi:sulfite exporter TauE/SafE family protein [Crocosphaera sp. UHCC 0190]|uniref:sulfite exporter TauE/SafE family protein n=1 Tax=Crocosphaera sp. UHCC 0190 TaxID=3110246 RepID=UPI002B21A798|nr:sulfite exporter TauE/SafE family protein [Crocosphaera sp. UHCC 0190]MEA5511401.1 sulfite exporter TauE/SafE family protein [Crocosphaera sp. UHCC 0190]
MEIIGFLLLGMLAGILSGLIGIGGGVLITPALIFIFKFSQQQAQGTTLALLIPPIGILAAWTYYQQGLVNWKAAILICLGFVLGGLWGAKIAVNLPTNLLEKIFGTTLIVIGLKMFFSH